MVTIFGPRVAGSPALRCVALKVFWLRSIQALKDPFADALGGIPPGAILKGESNQATLVGCPWKLVTIVSKLVYFT